MQDISSREDLLMAPLSGGDCVELAGEVFNKAMKTFTTFTLS